MSRHDRLGETAVVLGRKPATGVASTGSIKAGDHRWLYVAVAYADGGSAVFTAVVEESDDDATWTEIAGTSTTVTNPASADVLLWTIDRLNVKRYVRVTLSTTGTAPATSVVFTKQSDKVGARTDAQPNLVASI